MSEIKRKIFTSAEKAKVALTAVKGIKTINERASRAWCSSNASKPMEKRTAGQCG